MARLKDLDDDHKKRELEQEKIITEALRKYGLPVGLKRKDRRDRLKLYYDILNAIQQEVSNGGAKPTRVQFLSNTSYDKLMRYLGILKDKNMIQKDPLTLTDKGRQFLNDYKKVVTYI